MARVQSGLRTGRLAFLLHAPRSILRQDRVQNHNAQSLEGLRARNLVSEMAVVEFNCWLISCLSDKAANTPVYVDQAESVLLYVAIKSAVLATRSTSEQNADEHDVVVPNLVVKGAWLHDWCGHG